MDIAKSSLKLALARSLSLVSRIAGVAYFAQELGASALGSLFLFQALLAVSAFPANFGFGIAVEKRISEGQDKKQIVGTGIAIKSILVLVTVVSVFFFQTQINNYVGAVVSTYLGLAIILNEARRLAVNILQGQLRVGETAIFDLVYVFIWIGSGSFFVFLGYSVELLIISIIFGKVGQLLIAVSKLSIQIGKPSTRQAKSLFNYAMYSIIPEFDNQVYNWLDVLIIGLLLSQSLVGAYEIAWRVAGPVLLFTAAIGRSMFPQISQWAADGEMKKIEDSIPNIITPSIILVFPAFFGGLLLSKEILIIIFGNEFQVAWLALIVLLASKIPFSFRMIAGKTLLGLDRADLVMKTAVTDILLNIILNGILIWRIGILGAAIGTSVAMTIGSVHRLHYLSMYVNIKIPYREVGWCIFSSIIMFVCLSFVTEWIEPTTISQLGLTVVSGAFIYSALIALYPPLRIKAISRMQKWISEVDFQL